MQTDYTELKECLPMRICGKLLAKWTRVDARRHPSVPNIAGNLVLIFAASAFIPSQSLAWGGTLTAQSARSQAPIAISTQQTAQAQQNSGGGRPALGLAPAPAQAPATPQMPNWPAKNAPSAATVDWDGHALRIVASNSSLAQILKDVSVATGANLQGLGEDQRVFGTYGPGPARDVLYQLLDGSGYNILIVGDKGQGAPRRIELSARPAPGSELSRPAYQTQQNDAGFDENQQMQEPQPEEPPPPPVAVPNNPAPTVPGPGVVRTPQEIMQEMQQRQQQLQLQQQQPNPQN
jgi:hypothetical protein